MKRAPMKASMMAALAMVWAAGAGGCVALAVGAAAGVGTYAYVKGELTDTENVPLDRAYEAAQAAVKDMEFRVKDQAKDALGARIQAVEADGTDITIGLKPEGEKTTRFSVRVGIFGDESKSRLIMDTIKKHF